MMRAAFLANRKSPPYMWLANVRSLVIVVAVLAAACGSESPTSPTTTTPTSPTTVTWTPLLPPGGTASRSFTTSQAGTVSVTLTSVPVPLGFGIGVPRTTGGCLLSTSRVDATGATMSIAVDQGAYCVEVYDEGNLTTQSGFTVTITYP